MERVKVYLHSNKEEMYDIGYKLGMRDEVLHRFQGALYEVEFTLGVNLKTGKAIILEVEGIKLSSQESMFQDP